MKECPGCKSLVPDGELDNKYGVCQVYLLTNEALKEEGHIPVLERRD